MAHPSSNYLFVYGSLKRAGKNDMAKFLHRQSCYFGEGYFHGSVFPIDFYPGAIFDPEAASKVHGEIFRLDDPGKIFPVLDEYEGYGKDFPQPNEFIRTIIPVKHGQKIIDCWIYLYNKKCPGHSSGASKDSQSNFL